MSAEQKPKLNTGQQIEHLASKGVQFGIISKSEATHYLANNNNYFKLTAYRKNFPKHPDGDKKGQYIYLEFAYLKDLAIIDMRLRYLLLELSLDVEHFSKVKLIKSIEDSDEDGYSIVREYMLSLLPEQLDQLNNELDRNQNNPYCGDIIKKYYGNYPIWAFVEIIPFGRFVSFYKYCAKSLGDKCLKDDFYILLKIKELRNAAAHNNCILNDLRQRTSVHYTNYGVLRELASIGISRSTRDGKMSNKRLQQMVTLLYAHKKFVTSGGVHRHRADLLNDLVSRRMFKNIEYYDRNDTISSTFQFLKKVVDNWFACEYNK